MSVKLIQETNALLVQQNALLVQLVEVSERISEQLSELHEQPLPVTVENEPRVIV